MFVVPQCVDFPENQYLKESWGAVVLERLNVKLVEHIDDGVVERLNRAKHLCIGLLTGF
jgi:hypothetical protein